MNITENTIREIVNAINILGKNCTSTTITLSNGEARTTDVGYAFEGFAILIEELKLRAGIHNDDITILEF